MLRIDTQSGAMKNPRLGALDKDPIFSGQSSAPLASDVQQDTLLQGERADVQDSAQQREALNRMRSECRPGGAGGEKFRRVAEAYILHSDGGLEPFAGTREGWNKFVDTMNDAAGKAQKGVPSDVSKAFVMGHAGPDGIYPERFPRDDLTHSRMWVTDQNQVMVGWRGKEVPLSSLGWDKLNIQEFQVMGCGSANTNEGKNITEGIARTLKTRATGNTEIYWFHTECMQKSPFLEPLNAPRSFNYTQPKPSAGPRPK